jgi:hypothetical protein
LTVVIQGGHKVVSRYDLVRKLAFQLQNGVWRILYLPCWTGHFQKPCAVLPSLLISMVPNTAVKIDMTALCTNDGAGRCTGDKAAVEDACGRFNQCWCLPNHAKMILS